MSRDKSSPMMGIL